MPAKLFFAMERQINRIRADGDLRALSINGCTMGGEHVQKVHQALIAEQGEVYVIARSALVMADHDALAQLKSLM